MDQQPRRRAKLLFELYPDIKSIWFITAITNYLQQLQW
jgi:hypothetical protein